MKLTEDNYLDFWGNENPKCPHCGFDCDISEYEMYELYREDVHEVQCPSCSENFKIESCARWTFNTNLDVNPQ